MRAQNEIFLFCGSLARDLPFLWFPSASSSSFTQQHVLLLFLSAMPISHSGSDDVNFSDFRLLGLTGLVAQAQSCFPFFLMFAGDPTYIPGLPLLAG